MLCEEETRNTQVSTKTLVLRDDKCKTRSLNIIFKFFVHQNKLMPRQFKLKTKLSFSPNKPRESFFIVQAHIGKNPYSNEKHYNNNIKRSTSQSAHKHRRSNSRMFQQAHHIEATETYLIHDKNRPLSRTNGSSPPHSPTEIPMLSPRTLGGSNKSSTHSRSGGNHNLKTVDLAYKGKTAEISADAEAMTSLTRLILGDEPEEKEFYFQVLESTINGVENNYIEMGDSHFLDSLEIIPMEEK